MSFSNTSSRSKNLHPNSVRIGLMDPNIAQTWAQRVLSNGTTVASIKKGDTINHTTSQPIANGLFCQRIFGPCNDYTCACGHEKIRIHVNVNVAPPVCPECHVEWTVSSVRRQRLGSIGLLSPVTHKWFSDSRNYIPILSGINIKTYKSLKECKLFFPFLFQVVNNTSGPEVENNNFQKSSSVDYVLRVRTIKGSLMKVPMVPKEKVKVITNISKERYKNFVSKDLARSMKNLQIMTKSLVWSFNQERTIRNESQAEMLTKKNIIFYSLVSTTEILQKNQHLRYLGLVPTVNNQPHFYHYKVGQSLGLSTTQLIQEPKVTMLVDDGSSVKQKNVVSESSYQKSDKRILGPAAQQSKRSPLTYLWSPIRCCPTVPSNSVQPAVPMIRRGLLREVAYKDTRSLINVNLLSSAKETPSISYGLTLKNVKNTILSFSSNRCLKSRIIPVLRKTVKKQFTKLPNKQDNVYSDNLSNTQRQNAYNSDSINFGTVLKNSITKTHSPISNGHRSKEHVEYIQNLISDSSKLKELKLKEKFIQKNAVQTQIKSQATFGRFLYTFGNKTQNSYFPQLLKVFPAAPSAVLPRLNRVYPLFDELNTERAGTTNRAESSYGRIKFWAGPRSTTGRKLSQWPKKLFRSQKSKFVKGSSGFNLRSDIFNRDHSYPIRPSFTQPEDYRRQYLKFMGNNGLIHSMDIPIVRYIHKNPVNFTESYQNLLQRNTLSIPRLQISTGRRWFVVPHEKKNGLANYDAPSTLWPSRIERQLTEKETDKYQNLSLKHSVQPSIDVFFSETKSAAKEQTIKRILLQTGGGGVQQYLEKINLGMLIFMLQNDLFEIAPRLVKSQSTRRILAFIVNKIFKNINQHSSLLKQIKTGESAGLTKPSPISSSPHERVDTPVDIFPSESRSTKRERLPEEPTKDIGRSQSRLSGTNRPSFQRERKEDAEGQVGNNYYSIVSKIESLEKRHKDLKKEYKIVKKICSDFQNRKNANKRRYKLAFQLFRTNSNPAGMTLSSVPVLPPGLRPIIDVPKIGPITADLNIRYRALIFALRNLRELAYVDFRNTGAAQASVQEAVDDLLYTGGKTRREKGGMAMSQNLYKSLAIRLKGKHGRFRGNLLGKRVDYSGRSVIVVGPTLQIHQCGLPFEIAIKLFNPFLIRRLIQKGLCKNVYKAKQILMGGKFKPLIWALCREVMLEHLVLLNRAPTLHRLGVQAFMPILISGRAILLHPLVCTGFNADFDGDQMGVHVPLFSHARAEAWKMMWSRNNFLSPSSGEPILLPSQDMVLGCYYLTESFLGGAMVTSMQRPLTTTASDFSLDKRKTQFIHPSQLQDSCQIYKTPNNYFKSKNLIKPVTTNFQMQNSHVLSIKTILENYRHGFYTLQSCVWINSNKMVKKLEGGGCEGKIPALELRITPYGITRMLHSSGIKKSFFSNSTLLPAKKNRNSPFEICSIRTTIGRLLFNDVINKFDIF